MPKIVDFVVYKRTKIQVDPTLYAEALGETIDRHTILGMCNSLTIDEAVEMAAQIAYEQAMYDAAQA